jgi:hypothetical protein
MQTETNYIVNKISCKNLLTETQETLATNLAQEILEGKVKNFTIVDLWKIQKTRRSAQHSRRSFNAL